MLKIKARPGGTVFVGVLLCPPKGDVYAEVFYRVF